MIACPLPAGLAESHTEMSKYRIEEIEKKGEKETKPWSMLIATRLSIPASLTRCLLVPSTDVTGGEGNHKPRETRLSLSLSLQLFIDKKSTIPGHGLCPKPYKTYVL